jgi:predicted GNAT family acetyltransferase
VREDGRIVGGKGWKEKVYNRGMEEAPENGNGIIAFCTYQWSRNNFS